MFVKVFLVLETEQTSARITISDLRSTLSQYLKLQLESSTTIDFAWQKSRGARPPLPLGFARPEIFLDNQSIFIKFYIACSPQIAKSYVCCIIPSNPPT